MEVKDQAVQNLNDIKNILDELKITFWLDGGTCLGAYRDKDFCEGDEDDIDLCCKYDYVNFKDEIINRALKLGFTLFHNWKMEIALIRNGSKIDIFFYKKQNNEYFSHLYSGDNIDSWCVVPDKYYDNLENVKFYGVEFNIPSPIEEYLEFKYGDWRTKVHRKDYLCYRPEQNRVVRKHYEEI
jgi:phosphorylcholine metabolism protein LicD